jgi:hypothetical protein
MSRTFKQLGTQIGELVAHKNASYGSSFAKSGVFLRLLFPEGVPPERMEDALLLVRIFDKQMRIATAKDAFGESPYQDIAGYGLLGAKFHEERKKKCASVREGVGEESTEPSDSADRDANRRIIANAEEKSARSSNPPSPPRCGSTSASTDAPAPTAGESVCANQDAQRRIGFDYEEVLL